MTQAEVGAQLEPKMTRASVANIETGRQRVLAHTLVALADILGCNVTALLPAGEASRTKASGEVAVELQHKLGLTQSVAQKLATQFDKARRS
jgi:transcriptional regulator with XRE-family HTH domain